MQITRARRAFTLIELVVTIVLLGALAAIAAVSYSAFLTDARGEISSIEAAQDDRIVAAQTLLGEEGEYQAPVIPAFTPTGNPAVSGSVFSISQISTMHSSQPADVSIAMKSGSLPTGAAQWRSSLYESPDGVSSYTQVGSSFTASAISTENNTSLVSTWQTLYLCPIGMIPVSFEGALSCDSVPEGMRLAYETVAVVAPPDLMPWDPTPLPRYFAYQVELLDASGAVIGESIMTFSTTHENGTYPSDTSLTKG